MVMKRYLMQSLEDTYLFGQQLGRSLRANDIVALKGTLGAGKTTLTHGIAKGLGINSPISSPTFTLLFEHQAGERNLPLFHFDTYRLQEVYEWYDAGFMEYLDAGGVCVIEWADRITEVLPERTIWLNILLDEEIENRRTYILELSDEKFDFEHLKNWEID